MIRRVIVAVLNGLIAVLEAIVDGRERSREYWLIAPPSPAGDQATKEYVDRQYPATDVTGLPWEEPAVEDPWAEWEAEQGGETP